MQRTGERWSSFLRMDLAWDLWMGSAVPSSIEATKIKVDRGHIVTDQWGATGEAGIYAIGDVTGPPWLAHKASHEGIICVEKIKLQKRKIFRR